MTLFTSKRPEIGSEFWSIPVSDEPTDIFTKSTAWFMSGRHALSSIIAEIKAKKNVRTALLPSWCCDSMILPFIRSGIEIDFYPVYQKNGTLVQDVGSAREYDILLLMDYFGYTSDTVVYEGRPIVIRDVTHSFFSKTYNDADYYFGSLRKWCGFATGGFAFGTTASSLPANDKYVSLRKSAMRAKSEYIHGSSESKSFLSVFADAEEYLEESCVSGADRTEIELASKLDVDFIKAQRRKNAVVLLESLADVAIFPFLQENDCPLFVPISVPEDDRGALRQFLIEKKIYCPVHWPISKYHKLNEQTEKIYKSELSIVCDQRYGENDMHRVASAIKKYYKKTSTR